MPEALQQGRLHHKAVLGQDGSKPELLVVHQGNPVCGAGMAEAILLPAQD